MQAINEIIKQIIKQRKMADPQEIKAELLQDAAIKQFIDEHQAEITDQVIENSLSGLYEFYVQNNSKNPVMAGYRPKLFLNGHVIAVTYVPSQEKLRREQQENTKRHLQLIDLPQSLHDVRLSQIDVTPGRAQALTEISRFLTAYQTNPKQKGLYLSGDFGVGKTYLLAGLANQIAAMNKRVVFLHVPTFIASLASHFEDNSLQTEIDRVAKCDLLVLDDIGAETLSQWSRDDVLGVILQARMDNVLPTFFSSNLALTDLADHFKETKNALDPVKAARLMERVRFLAKEVVVSGPNRRQ